MSKRVYVETFDSGPAGWFGYIDNAQGPKRLEVRNSAIISRSPWWIDYNHAPPGAGYLHMVFCLTTKGASVYGEHNMEVADVNRFVDEEFPTDFTNAKLSFRLKGELETRGANLVLLCQGTVGEVTSGWVLTGSPLTVKPEWSEQTIIAAPDSAHWTCLGARHNRTKMYGKIELSTILRDVSSNIMLILFPLNVVPMGPVAGDPHVLRAGRDYPVWQSRLPEGYVLLDEVRIEFA